MTALYTSSNAGKGLSYSLSANGEEYTVSGVYEENEADITVAAIYKNKPVTKVKNSNEYTAFRGKIGTLVFPETIAELCQNTFHNCTVKRLILLNPKIVINLYLKPSISSLQIEELFYYGSASEWRAIGNKEKLEADKVFYYSETEPASTGNFWHYDLYGNPVSWTAANLPSFLYE